MKKKSTTSQNGLFFLEFSALSRRPALRGRWLLGRSWDIACDSG